MPRKILLTAGPTREPIDPVRYISNYSTGTFGYLIAEEFRRKGYEVCLITGPVNLLPPKGVTVVRVETAEEMKKEVFSRIEDSDCLIMAAAVADFRPKKKSGHKIKKKDNVMIALEKTPDILFELGKRYKAVKVGFALETENPLKNGRDKLTAKGLDMVIVNAKTADNDPFGLGEKTYIIINREGEEETFEKTEKYAMARKIVEKVGMLIQ